MIWRKILNRLKGNSSSVVTYIVEVSLIILSILIAVQTDRCNQNNKNEAKLHNYLQSMHQDLLDKQVKDLSTALGKYIDWGWIASSERLTPCLSDRAGFVEDVHNDLFIFLRLAQLRAFHLNVAIQNFDRTIKEMKAYVGPVE